MLDEIVFNLFFAIVILGACSGCEQSASTSRSESPAAEFLRILRGGTLPPIVVERASPLLADCFTPVVDFEIAMKSISGEVERFHFKKQLKIHETQRFKDLVKFSREAELFSVTVFNVERREWKWRDGVLRLPQLPSYNVVARRGMADDVRLIKSAEGIESEFRSFWLDNDGNFQGWPNVLRWTTTKGGKLSYLLDGAFADSKQWPVPKLVNREKVTILAGRRLPEKVRVTAFPKPKEPIVLQAGWRLEQVRFAGEGNAATFEVPVESVSQAFCVWKRLGLISIACETVNLSDDRTLRMEEPAGPGFVMTPSDALEGPCQLSGFVLSVNGKALDCPEYFIFDLNENEGGTEIRMTPGTVALLWVDERSRLPLQFPWPISWIQGRAQEPKNKPSTVRFLDGGYELIK